MAEYVHAWLHPCLASEQQTVQKNTKWQIASRLEKPQRGGKSGISVIQTENIMKKKTQHTETGSVCNGACVCPRRKGERGLARSRFVKPSLPNAAIFKQHIPEKMR